MKKTEKWIIIVLVLIALGAIGTAIYFKVNIKCDVKEDKINKEPNVDLNIENDARQDGAINKDTDKMIEKTITLNEFNNIEYFKNIEENTIYNIIDFTINNKKVDIIIDNFNNKFIVNGVSVRDNIFQKGSDLYIKVFNYNEKILLMAYGTSGFNWLKIYDKEGSIEYELYSPTCDRYYVDYDFDGSGELELSKLYANKDLPIQDIVLVSSLYPYCKDEYDSADIRYKLVQFESGWELKVDNVICSNEEF